MAILSSRLSSASGLGGAPSAGAYSTSTYGMGSMMASAYSTGAGAISTGGGALRDTATNVSTGHFSMVAIEVGVILIVLFYLWTHSVQGGG